MKTSLFYFKALFVLLFSFSFSSCSNDSSDLNNIEEDLEISLSYEIQIESVPNGKIVLKRDSNLAIPGSEVVFEVVPDEDYVLDESNIQFPEGTAKVEGLVYKFTMPSSVVKLKAEFHLVPSPENWFITKNDGAGGIEIWGLDSANWNSVTDIKILIPKTIGGKPVTVINHHAFSGYSSITEVYIPDSVVFIGYSAFQNTANLKTVRLSNSIISIEPETFWGCGILSIDIPDSVVEIHGDAFRECFNLSSIKFPKNITSIKAFTFGGCEKLTSIKIPESVISIENGAFAYCGFSSIEIPSSVASIGGGVFEGCDNLKEVKLLRTTPPTMSKYSFAEVSKYDVKFWVKGSLDAYKEYLKYNVDDPDTQIILF